MKREELIKIGFLLGLTFLTSFFLGKVSAFFFIGGFFDFWRSFGEFLLKASVSLTITGFTFSLPVLFLNTPETLFLALLLNCLGFLLGFYSLTGFQNLNNGLLLILLFFIFQYFFFKESQKRARKFVSFSPRDIFSSKTTHLLLGLSLIFSLSFCLALKEEIAEKELIIPRDFFEKILEERLGQNLDQQNPGEVLKFLQEEMKETAQEGTLRQELGFKPELFDFKKSPLDDLTVQIQKTIEPFLKYLPFLAMFSFFFVLRILVSFLMIFLPWLISISFKILLKTKFLKIIEKQEAVQKISL